MPERPEGWEIVTADGTVLDGTPIPEYEVSLWVPDLGMGYQETLNWRPSPLARTFAKLVCRRASVQQVPTLCGFAGWQAMFALPIKEEEIERVDGSTIGISVMSKLNPATQRGIGYMIPRVVIARVGYRLGDARMHAIVRELTRNAIPAS